MTNENDVDYARAARVGLSQPPMPKPDGLSLQGCVDGVLSQVAAKWHEDLGWRGRFRTSLSVWETGTVMIHFYYQYGLFYRHEVKVGIIAHDDSMDLPTYCINIGSKSVNCEKLSDLGIELATLFETPQFGELFRPVAARFALRSKKPRTTKEDGSKSAAASRSSRSLLSLRGHPLVYDGRECSVPVLTVENYVKWYGFQLVHPDGRVEDVSYGALQEFADVRNVVAYSDHVPNAELVPLLAAKMGWHLDRCSYELVVGRWEAEVVNVGKYDY